MRFAAVIVPKEQPQQRTPAAEIIRRIALGEPIVRTQPVRLQELPLELDQRVRLVGEW